MSDLLDQVEALRDNRSSQPRSTQQPTSTNWSTNNLMSQPTMTTSAHNRLTNNHNLTQSTTSVSNHSTASNNPMRNYNNFQSTSDKYASNSRNYDQGDGSNSPPLLGATGYTYPTQQNSFPTSASQQNNIPNNSLTTSNVRTNNFAGFKSGFLINKTSEPSKNDKRVNETRNLTETNIARSKKTYNKDMPFIKAKQGSFDRGVELPEVQEAMKANDLLLQNKDAWLTDDLLTRVKNNDFLHRCLSDPAYVQAVTELQTNPQATIARYHNNPDMQRFLRDFMKIMGEHFTQLGATTKETKAQNTAGNQPRNDNVDININQSSKSLNTSSAATATDDARRMQEVLTDPEVMQILKDPRIQRLFETLRTNPSHGQRIVQTAEPDMRQKIKKLVEVGLLSFQM